MKWIKLDMSITINKKTFYNEIYFNILKYLKYTFIELLKYKKYNPTIILLS